MLGETLDEFGLQMDGHAVKNPDTRSTEFVVNAEQVSTELSAGRVQTRETLVGKQFVPDNAVGVQLFLKTDSADYRGDLIVNIR
ncbi:MAG: hypothetical protein WCW66_05965 [Patescibacteria group bacterium]|jgi:hypothetical protein